MGESDHLIDSLMEWERKFESAEKHKQFLQDGDNPLEATAWENGYVPEAEGLPSDQLDFRIQGLLPPLAYMVSRPRQPITVGEELLHRFDAGVRPTGCVIGNPDLVGTPRCMSIKLMERLDDNFLLLMWFDHGPSPPMLACFTLMSKLADQKPWKRPTSTQDPSRGIILDLQENYEWKMPATVMLHSNDIAIS